MNREIKFRIWSTIQKIMNYPKKIVLDFDWFGVTTQHYLDDSSPNEYPIANYENLIVMQFTGELADGKEVYEGDIFSLLWEDLYGNTGFVNGFVTYIHSFFVIQIIHPDTKEKQYISLYETLKRNPVKKIIGNIYENPELLSE